MGVQGFLVCILGDMNMPPEQLDDSGVLASTLPNRSLRLWCSAEPYTCTMGSCRHIDYGLVDGQAQVIVGPLVAYHGVPWKTQIALTTELLCAPSDCWQAPGASPGASSAA